MKRFKALQVYLIFIMLILSVFLITGCGGGGGEVTEHWATDTAPTVTAVVPLDGATGVAISTKIITATFSEAMNPDTLTTASFTLACPAGTSVTGTVTYAGNVATLTLPTTPNLPSNAVCTATVTTGATDVAGTPLASNFVWSFTTAVQIIPGATCTIATGATIPTVTASDPTSGNQNATTSTTGVAGSGKLITATFSLAMNPATINSASPGTLSTFTLKDMTTANGTIVPGTVAMNTANTIATFTTSAALLANTSYTAIITTAATSATGTPIACAYAWSFKTAGIATGLAPINMGLAAPFGIAATAGVVNVGATTVQGDVVLDPLATCNTVTVGSAGLIGSCNSVPPTIIGTVISPLYPDAGVTSLAVKNALRQTFIDISPANLSTGVYTIPDGTVMGTTGVPVLHKDLFYPGIYKTTSGGMLITGDLTLDAQGDANAVFVFQSDSTLTMAAGAPGSYSRILLINGAKASNVWWWVGSAATFGTYSEFQGNVLVYSNLTMTTGATSCGRLFAGASTDGAFVFGANVVSVPGQPFAPGGTRSTTCQ